MPHIRPNFNSRNNTNEISKFCHTSQALISLYAKLADAETEIANGDDGEDFFEIARQIRNNVHGPKD